MWVCVCAKKSFMPIHADNCRLSYWPGQCTKIVDTARPQLPHSIFLRTAHATAPASSGPDTRVSYAVLCTRELAAKER